MKKEQQIESLRAELLSQPVLGTIINEIKTDPGCISWVGLSGSRARGAELGTVSDDDLVIILGENQTEDPLSMEKMDGLLSLVLKSTEKVIFEKGIIPVFASTIRLEDAEMAMASMVNSSGLPLRMVHLLVYPSIEAAVAFEPPLLNRGLFGRSLTLLGDENMAREVVKFAISNDQVIDINLSLGGLDGISDNFRMLMLNQHILPKEFLGPQMIHVLDYTLKWIMAGIVERRFGVECGTWGEILGNFSMIEKSEEIVTLINDIRGTRKNHSTCLEQVEMLTRKTITLWPTLSIISSKRI